MAKFLLAALGISLIMEGIPYFAFPDRVKSWLARLSIAPAGTLRMVGLAVILSGLAIIWAVRTFLFE
jgi:uncharacterized protein YjeT (DUF2065 family)